MVYSWFVQHVEIKTLYFRTQKLPFITTNTSCDIYTWISDWFSLRTFQDIDTASNQIDICRSLVKVNCRLHFPWNLFQQRCFMICANTYLTFDRPICHKKVNTYRFDSLILSCSASLFLTCFSFHCSYYHIDASLLIISLLISTNQPSSCTPVHKSTLSPC